MFNRPSMDPAPGPLPTELAGGRAEGHPVRPGRAFLVVILAVLIAEGGYMWFLESALETMGSLAMLVDILILLAITVPVLYTFLVRPMVRTIHEKSEVEEQLRLALRDLDQKVRVRTAELEAANQALTSEARERQVADAQIHFQSRLLDVVQQGVVATGDQGTISYWNQYAEFLFGWTEAEMLGQPLVRLLNPRSDDSLPGRLATQGWWQGERQVCRRDGTTFPVYITSAALWGQDRSVTGIVYTFIDISDRKAAEEELRHSEEKYSLVVEHSPTAVFIYNRGRLIFGNPRLYELLGRTQAELDRMDPIEVLHPEDRALVAAKWSSRLMGDPEPPNTDYRLITPGGMRWINGRGTLVQYRGETMVLGNFQDVTERHVMEQALRNSKLAMQELTSRMLTAQEDERRRVALDLHDSIGQSLSAIKFMVERAVEEFADGDPAKPLAVLRATVPVIQKSVEEVRHISMGLRPSTLDDLGLLATLDWFSREFQTTYPHIQVHKVRGVEEAQIPDGLKTSIFRIHQEAMNNAAKHSQATRITVALRHTGDQLQLAVQDDGQGFDPAATPAPSGAGGFGLASMRERAEFLGGTFTLTSSQGQGTQVLVQWPVGLVSY